MTQKKLLMLLFIESNKITKSTSKKNSKKILFLVRVLMIVSIVLLFLTKYFPKLKKILSSGSRVIRHTILGQNDPFPPNDIF